MLLAASCGKDEFTIADIGSNYFPLRTGYYQTYNISETIYSEVAPPENRTYQLRVEVADSLPNTHDGGYTYVLHRSTRTGEQSLWQDLDTWSVRRSDRELVVNEGNRSFLKLAFPVRRSNAWNGNKYNNLDEDRYEILTLDEPFSASGITFEQALTVQQENNEDLIVFQDKREEVYAREVGLIYKETIQLRYCTSDDCLGQQKIKSGVIYKQEIIDYGMR
jgi:hypothetical protein